jgi:predicted O-methyltransferase YrrM
MEESISKTKNYIDNKLLPIIREINEPLEGNLFMQHLSLEYSDEFINKVKNICTLSKLDSNKDVLEIGFNSGFSAVLILLSNDNINLTCVDICEHRYTIPCFNKIKEDFGDRINLLSGNSVHVLSTINSDYDMIHIDGSHATDVATSDIEQSYRLCKINGILIMDDYDAPWLSSLWDNYVNLYNLKNIETPLFFTNKHDVKIKS